MLPDVPLEAEQALLGAFFVEGARLLDEISDQFTTEIFGVPQHRHIARAILQVIENRGEVDAVTVNAALAELGLLGAIGSEQAFALESAHGTAGNVAHYLELVVASARLRAVKAIGRALAESGNADVARKGLDEIATGATAKAQRVGDVEMRVLERLDHERKEGTDASSMLPTGFTRLDEFIGGFRPGQLYVFSARPGSGKSSLAAALVANQGERSVPTCAFWLEDEAEDFGQRLLQRAANVPSTAMRHGANAGLDQWERLGVAAMAHAGQPIFVDDTHGLSAIDISRRMRRYKREHGVRVFLVDHLGEVALDTQDAWDKHHIALGKAARIYRDTGKELGCVTILFAQMNREVVKRPDQKPRLTDIEGSDQVGQVARFVAFVRIPDPEAEEGDLLQHNLMCLDVVKNNKGPRGALTLRWREEVMGVYEP